MLTLVYEQIWRTILARNREVLHTVLNTFFSLNIFGVLAKRFQTVYLMILSSFSILPSNWYEKKIQLFVRTQCWDTSKKVQKAGFVFKQTHVISLKITLLQYFKCAYIGKMYIYIIQIKQTVNYKNPFHKKIKHFRT